ncbi:hypothetical protein [Mycobacterium sp. 1274756.6]|uniref:hypothetical protein n=1 Tax=Mycobacterium sp. 1274756.6 TaxID=1834076 RepID=UPI0007FFF90B|nr:hypothetical protein [Mycobacterium sp. 1274756.6]OBJ67985.1 hypothetical protein A5643_16030 [Mycobacterium sp. 1274756.6]
MDPDPPSASSRTALLAGWLSILTGAFLLFSSLLLLAFQLLWVLLPASTNESAGPLPIGALVLLAASALACCLLVGGILLLRRHAAGLWIIVGANVVAIAASVVAVLADPMRSRDVALLVVPATITVLALMPSTRSWLHPSLSRR